MPIGGRARGYCRVLAVGVILALIGEIPTHGQEGASTDQAGGSARRREDPRLIERWKREAADYTIVARTEPETVLRLRSEPVLRWTNPVRETDDGLVFVWIAHGRPEAVSCFYRVRYEGRPTEAHEFHSLSSVGLTADLNGRTVWSPSDAGVTFRPVPGAPRPAATPGERLRQLRSMARDFQAYVDIDKGRTELRQLSQPIFRFEPERGGSPDGALFAYVLTTDPEALLLIEERPGAGGPVWHFAFARMSDHSLSARHRDKLVWEVARDPENGNPNKPYCCRWDVGPKP